METIELRVYNDIFDMANEFDKYKTLPGYLVKIHDRKVVDIHGNVIYFKYNRKIPEAIQGMHFTRVYVDVRVSKEVMSYCMARLRHPQFPVDNHVRVFHTTIH